jgi:peptidoglycan hydrolase FlgJ
MIEITSTATIGSPASDGIAPEYRAKAQEAAEKFEAHFVAQVFKQMRRTTREMSDDDGAFATRANDDMLEVADTLVADSIAHQRAFGIADILLRQLLPLKEHSPAVASLNEEPQPER